MGEVRGLVDEVPEENIEQAEATSPREHDHEGIAGEDGTLLLHLSATHGLDVPDGTSAATQSGLHDRLHDQRGAADD